MSGTVESLWRRVPRWAKLYYAGAAIMLGTMGMHIPDGYLSPVTCVVMLVLVLPFWAMGIRRLRETVSARSVPLIALMAAFSFVIMMFNVPLPGGTSGHAVGAALAALLTATEFGIQPALFRAADGTPLYAPYPLSVAVPAMLISHLAVASVVEAVLTVLVVAYLQRTNARLLGTVQQPQLAAELGGFGRLRGLWIVLAVLVIASPLGLLAPGTAWGEWGAQELARLGLGFVPQGLARLSNLWGAPMPRYNVPALGNANVAYILSALVGISVTILLVWLFVTLLTMRHRAKAPHE
jgi:ABC-type Co2+ transport system permease subunit